MAAADTDKLSDAIRASLRYALSEEDRGDEPVTYVEEGGDNPFLVYDRAGRPCFTCRTPIERIVQGGRSTYFCPTCQPAWRKSRTARKAVRRSPA
jgi:formamidopyrimidine-DNA glycosylase